MSDHLLAAVDGSAQSIAAARWAAAEAVRHGLPLRLVHAQTWLDDLHADPGRPADIRALTTRMLADAKQTVQTTHPALEIRAELLGGGDPVDVLTAAAAKARMLVLGSRGLGGFGGLLVGSVGLAVTARCDAPTVLVRAEGPRRPGHRDGGEVVVGVDTRAPAAEVLGFAFREASLRGSRVRAVHGWTPPPVWGYAGWVPPQPEAEQFRAIEDELLTLAMTGWQEKHPEVELVRDIRTGSGSAALVDACTGADLVVVGRRRHHGGMRLGPVAHAVLHHAQAPVVVVPHD
ncbi:universal stress protein [Kitasatospora sp. NPDC059571]|uniref:universal stress protein n=1 Tax=Kitasatospora sp. NPDC059571 TaxID=3346871 RepID=UPI0036CFDD86